jgi:uncharacterized protein YqjF (DUF2071 family)
MVHYEVEASALQRVVPFELDLRRGRAFISVVAFTMRGMRPHFGGAWTAWLLKPIATHDFLNVRTYVRHKDESGIYFMAEWLTNRLSVLLGPTAFGLPYHLGRIQYDYSSAGRMSGGVEDFRGRGTLSFEAKVNLAEGFCECKPGSLCEWLMERYTAFTCAKGQGRFFRVWHPPWRHVSAEVEVSDRTLLENNWQFFKSVKMVGAHFSPGVYGVWMGRPHRAKCEIS